MSHANRITTLDRLVSLSLFARWRGQFTGREAAAHLGISLRTTYRYLDALMAIDERLAGEAGVGYIYRNHRKETARPSFAPEENPPC